MWPIVHTFHKKAQGAPVGQGDPLVGPSPNESSVVFFYGSIRCNTQRSHPQLSSLGGG